MENTEKIKKDLERDLKLGVNPIEIPIRTRDYGIVKEIAEELKRVKDKNYRLGIGSKISTEGSQYYIYLEIKR